MSSSTSTNSKTTKTTTTTNTDTEEESKTIEIILKSTINKENENSLIKFLPNLSQEIQQETENSNNLLSFNLTERIIVANLEEINFKDSIEYLCSCFNNTNKITSKFLKEIKELKSLLIRYICLLIEMPLMFSNKEEEEINTFDFLLNLVLNNSDSFSMEIFTLILSSENKEIKKEFLKQIRVKFIEKVLLNDFSFLISLLKLLNFISGFSEESLFDLISLDFNNFSKFNSKSIQISFLGSFFNFSLLGFDHSQSQSSQNNFLDLFFPIHSSNTELKISVSEIQQIKSSTNNLRLLYTQIIKELHLFLKQLIKSKSKQLVLSFFKFILYLNYEKTKMVVDAKLCSSDGFLFNLFYVLLEFCKPLFMSDTNGFNKLRLIDLGYLVKETEDDYLVRFGLKFTKINATSEEEKDIRQKYSSSNSNLNDSTKKDCFNFVTELFFITSFYFHLLNKQIQKYYDLLKELKQIQKHYTDLPTSGNMMLYEGMKNRLRLHYFKLLQIKFSFDLCFGLDYGFSGLGSSSDLYEFKENCVQFVLLFGRVLVKSVLLEEFKNKRLSKDKSKQNDNKETDLTSFCEEKVLRMEKYGLEFPFKCEASDYFKSLPEFMLEDLGEYVLFRERFTSSNEDGLNVGNEVFINEILNFIVLFLKLRVNNSSSSSKSNDGGNDKMDIDNSLTTSSNGNIVFVKNVYVLSKYVEILHVLTQEQDSQSFSNIDFIKNAFKNNKMCVENLVSGLVGLYVDIEKTGLHTQFYDKFGIRYSISQLLKFLWFGGVVTDNDISGGFNAFGTGYVSSNLSEKNELSLVYRSKMKAESENKELFLKFCNLLMNDTTYLLDEGLRKLKEIHVLQIELENQGMDERQKQEKEKQLKDLEKHATGLIQLANSTVDMFKYLSTEIKLPFLRGEIVDRLAAMLNFNLVVLVGEKCTELKVKNPEKYSFKPRRLLSDIIDVYLNLGVRGVKDLEFINAIVRDGRSFDVKYFNSASNIMRKYNVKSQDEVEEMMRFIAKLEETYKENMKQEEDFADAPDEFLDPVLFHLMEDPVLLPTSNVIVDRSTIISHLLSDSTDPFNRKHLKEDMLVSCDELRERISKWKEEKRRK